MSEIEKTIQFPSDLWARVEARASSEAGMPIKIDGEPGTMRYMNPGYLVAILVKRGLDELDAEITEEQLSKLIETVYEESDGTANIMEVHKGSPLEKAIEAGEFDKMEENVHEWLEERLYLTLSDTIKKLQGIHDNFTEDMELRDPPNTGKPHESLDMFVDFDVVYAALIYLKAAGQEPKQSYTEIFAPVEMLESVAKCPGIPTSRAGFFTPDNDACTHCVCGASLEDHCE